MKAIVASDWNTDALSLYFDSLENEFDFVEFQSLPNTNWPTAIKQIQKLSAEECVVFCIFQQPSILGTIEDNTDVEKLTNFFRQDVLDLAKNTKSLFFEILCPYEQGIQKAYTPLMLSRETDITHHINLVIQELSSASDKIFQTAVTKNLGATNLKNFCRTKCPYALEQIFEIGGRIIQTLKYTQTRPAKVVVCDLDNTLWSGVIGDQDFHDIRVGGHDPLGEAHSMIQQKLLDMKTSGQLIVAVSKNKEQTVKEFFAFRDDMPLKLEDFSACRFNFNPKSENIYSISQELNILTKDFVVLDDNAGELISIKNAIPDIGIITHETTAYSMYQALIEDIRLWAKATTNEDRIRNDFYAQEHKRKEIIDNSKKSTSEPLSLASLEIQTEFALNRDKDFERIVQLLNKTSQFNFTTRRFNSGDFKDWVNSNSANILSLTARDKFGDYGLIGFISFNCERGSVELFDFVFSCRAMLRGLEDLLFAEFLRLANNDRKAEIKINFEATEKNALADQFREKYGITPFLDEKKISDIKNELNAVTSHIIQN